ncbi:MAG: hypothetical protein M3220_07095 [Chloroflexota bacterium]|nr:hypothetical protein [Chloroflexota bacterium]
MIEQAIQNYHDLLDDQSAAENFERLKDMMQQRHLAFGDRLLCTVLRPHFLTPDEYATMQNACETLLGAFHRLYEAMLTYPELRAEAGLTALEEAAFAINPGYRTPTPTGRLDSFLSHEPEGPPTIHFVEYNAETPAGAGYEDVLSYAFFELPVMQQFQEQYEITMIPLRQRVLDTLLEMHREANGHLPATIAIVDWEDVPTTNEFEIYCEFFHEQGYDALITSPERMEYDGRTLHAEGKPIHIIYKRVLGSELLQRYGLEHPIIYALRDGNVTMVNPFRCKPLHKKMSFALLSDERYEHLYTPQQREAIARHIPWTRKVEERETLIDGQRVELLSYINEHQAQFVLKPNDEYGGKGVVIGWEASADAWQAAIEEGLREPAIVQRKVKIAREDFPTYVNGRLDISERLVDLDPYLFEGKTMHGLLTRLASTTLLNVTAGGGSVTPSFIIEKKS